MKFHRQLLALSLSAALTAGMTITASAQGTVTVSVNGTKSNVSAFTNADWRTMVPAEIADSLGLSYTAQDSSVTFTETGITETYTAIQQGTVNGAENGLTNIASLSWDECTKYIVETKHVYNTDSFIMDKTYFEALPEEYQTIIRDAAVEAGKRCTDLVLEANESIRPEVEAADCEFIETDVTLWQEALDGFLEEKYPDLVSYADQIKAADPT